MPGEKTERDAREPGIVRTLWGERSFDRFHSVPVLP